MDNQTPLVLPSLGNSQGPGKDHPYVQDPTSLTTQQLWREIAALKELLIERLASVEKSIEVAHEDMTRVPTDVQKQVGALRDVVFERFEHFKDRNDERQVAVNTKFIADKDMQDEKFRSIEKQFQERDTRVAGAAATTKSAVDAALQAAKEAVAEQNKSNVTAIMKSEAATSKQIDQLGEMIRSSVNGLDGKIGDVKDRITRLESYGLGADKMHTSTQTGASNIVGIVGLIIGSLIGIAGVVIALMRLAG